ncbi:fructose-bisphosphate aldolase [Nocardia blacklockiae]|nr:fructose-bisphosphate aldolase [Nocardia blacklockiae]
MLYCHGAGDGTALLLPYDHGLEHGPRDFAAQAESSDAGYVLDLAVAGGFNAVALHIGHARKSYAAFAGRVSLVVKLNGKTEIPPDDEPLSPLNSTVEEAVSLGADAVGYTLYVGSPRQSEDFAALRTVRQDCERFGMPLIVWSYPRGSAIARKGGRDSFYAIDYAARVAAELGADVVKVNWPSQAPATEVPPAYRRPFSASEQLAAIVRSAGRTLVLLSGGERADADKLLDRAQTAVKAGVLGLIFGRNFLERDRSEALALAEKLHHVLSDPIIGHAG